MISGTNDHVRSNCTMNAHIHSLPWALPSLASIVNRLTKVGLHAIVREAFVIAIPMVHKVKGLQDPGCKLNALSSANAETSDPLTRKRRD